MTVVVEDVANGMRASDDVESGKTATRIFIASEVGGTPNERLFSVLEEQAIPLKGDPHPFRQTLRVFSRESTPLDVATYKITVMYRQPSGSSQQEADDTQQPILSINATTRSVTTNQFIDGAGISQDMTVYYTPDEPSGENAVIPQPFEAQIEVPSITITLQRKETKDTLAKSIKYVGHVNVTRILEDPPYSWLISKISSTTKDGGESYDVTYELQRSVGVDVFGVVTGGWNVTAVYIDPDTGKPPSDIRETGQFGVSSEQHALTDFTIYPTREFRELDIGIDLL